MKFALLDATGNLIGYRDPLPDEHPGDSEVGVPADCDLEIGRYRWDGVSFWPRRDIVLTPSPADWDEPGIALRAIAKGFASLDAGGLTIDPETLAWVEAWCKSFDARGRR